MKDSRQPQLIKAFKGRLKKWDGSISGRILSTPHMKCYFRYQELKEDDDRVVGSSDHQPVELQWFLLTSSNLSQAAWGVYQSNNKQLYIKSYEMGILFLPTLLKNITRIYSCSPNHPLLGTSAESSRKELTKDVVARFFASHRSTSNEYLNSDSTQLILNVFFPIPFRVPPENYEEGNDYPWVWDVPLRIPDRFGRMKEG